MTPTLIFERATRCSMVPADLKMDIFFISETDTFRYLNNRLCVFNLLYIQVRPYPECPSSPLSCFQLLLSSVRGCLSLCPCNTLSGISLLDLFIYLTNSPCIFSSSLAACKFLRASIWSYFIFLSPNIPGTVTCNGMCSMRNEQINEQIF